MALADGIFITIKGVGGHALKPWKTLDAIVPAADIMSSIVTVVSRVIDPFAQAVASITSIRAVMRLMSFLTKWN